jgi:hypothetical protein
MPEPEAPDRGGMRGAGRSAPRHPGSGSRTRRGRRSRRRSAAPDRQARRAGRARRISRVVGVLAVALVALALLTDIGESPDGSSSSGTADDGGEAATTLVPPDVDEPRATVDLATTPPEDDAVEVARWWAATYTAYIGAEAPDAVADRLAPTTTASLMAQLTAIPPAASYDAGPSVIEGVSHRAPVDEADGTSVRVTVETTGALVVYDLVLVAEAGSSGESRWLVDQAARL